MLRDFTFLGTGTSGGVPNVSCLLEETIKCKVCLSASRSVPPTQEFDDNRAILPIWNKNRRRNTSGLLRFDHSDGRVRNILIDCGKTFYDSALHFLTPHKHRRIDAVILTHGHADAMLGLDDLRQWTLRGAIQDSISIYLSLETFDVVSRSFPYLVDSNKATGGGAVPALQFHIFDKDRISSERIPPFIVEDELQVDAFEVCHGTYNDGTDYFCMGFQFDKGAFTYISDANRIPEQAKEVMLQKGERLGVLVLDALKEESHPSHFGIKEAIAVAAELKPKQLLLTGFCHHVDHDTLHQRLKADQSLLGAGINAEPAYDGLKIEF
ncbi:hypothetical protein HDV05_000077 [Chytridiales sp. JEL 0842]|nr:hypothetical protein HDV05_000077 [Chytridiales sp. JEL 0842]